MALAAFPGEAGAHAHDAQRQGRRAQPRHHGVDGPGQAQPGEVAGQAQQGRDQQRVARQLAQQAVAAVARQAVHGGDIGHGHGKAHDQRHDGLAGAAGQAGGQGQADIGIEAVAALRRRGQRHRRGPEHGAGQPGQRHAAGHQGRGGLQQLHGMAGADGGAQDGLEQQRGEQHEIHHALGAGEEFAGESQFVAQGPAQGDEHEIGQNQQGNRHGTWKEN
ncbi:Uncharacterised protein [Bordetella pertussis]|nr:Uncharacterised protein [Bordetella pertussis]CPN66569.1 Uncharacterised protein [Bordetella pertussis]CPO57043.1 Uncharacterised protein [Bordetella pertussis]CRD92439.1 Uncharacterised protein [Bordetella pertussis]